MRLTICIAAAVVFCSASALAKPTTFLIKETTWTFTDKKEGKVKETIDADGNLRGVMYLGAQGWIVVLVVCLALGAWAWVRLRRAGSRGE